MPFFRLPRRFDALRLRDEIAAIPPQAWVPHPNGILGNSSVRLISVNGDENDLVEGTMRETTHMTCTPYIRQVLASFGVPWSRSRLLRLAPGATVPPHADINYHWFYRVRLHVPVMTREEVRFHCDGTSVHMAAGEAWIFDNWRLHNVSNPTPDERIHLVADTAGNAAFWQLAGAGENGAENPLYVGFEAGREPVLLTERSILRPIMNPAELELLVGNMRGELISQFENADSRLRLSRYHGILDNFVRDWRHYYMLHGEDRSGWENFSRLRDSLRNAARTIGEGIVLRTNRIAVHKVLEGRVLRVCLGGEPDGALEALPSPAARNANASSPAGRACLTQPLFIVAAPRSGSSLLFETLASSEQIATLGGEAHWLIETIAELRPGAPGVDSNRLVAAHASPRIVDRIQCQILERLVDGHGEPLIDGRVLKFLEKTPKNALRIPFFDRVFPDARFVFLWRDPRANISSIIEAWRSGKWQTYRRLEGFDPPWSLLLPPGWETLRGSPLEELAAFQWRVTNATVLDDLASLTADRWTAVEYDNLVADPASVIQSLCQFAGIEFDAALAERVSRPLPAAKHTLTPADPLKWKRNEAAIERILPVMEPTWRRLLSVTRGNGIRDAR